MLEYVLTTLIVDIRIDSHVMVNKNVMTSLSVNK